MEFWGYVAVVLIGIVLGSIGAGGSMLAIPVLVYLFSVDMVTASAYSLFLVGVTSLAGVVIKQKEKLVDVRAGLLFGIPSIITAFIARKWILGMIPDVIWKTPSLQITKGEFLLFLFSILMMVASAMAVRKKRPAGSLNARSQKVKLARAGLFVGLIAGLVGIGGGFLILPALIVSGRVRFSIAVGTALFIIACNSLLGFCGDLLNHSIDWHFLLPLTGLAIAGIILGGWAAHKVSIGSSFQKSFPWITLVAGTGIFLTEIIRCTVRQ